MVIPQDVEAPFGSTPGSGKGLDSRQEAKGVAMRRSWFAGIVVPALMGTALSGCATNQKRLVSTPTPRVEEAQPEESGRRLFSWRWWTKPDSVAAHQNKPVEPTVAPSGGHLDDHHADPWPAPKSDRLSRYFPALGRRQSSRSQESSPEITAPTASRAGHSRDGGVRQAFADQDDAQAARDAAYRRPADDPPLLPVPIPVPVREHNRPAPPAQGEVDLGVSGASETINESALGHSAVRHRLAKPDPIELPPSEPSTAPTSDQAATLLNTVPVADAPTGEPTKDAESDAALPTPGMPDASLPPTKPATQEVVPNPSEADWPTAVNSGPNPKIGSTAPSAANHVEQTTPSPIAPKADAKPMTDNRVTATVKNEESANPSPEAAPKLVATPPTLASVSQVESPPVISSATKTPEIKQADQPEAAAAQTSPEAGSALEPPKPSIQPSATEVDLPTPSWTPTSQVLPATESATAQSRPYFSGYATPQAASEGHGHSHNHNHVWGLGLFSGKLLPCLQKKFHFHKETPTVYASAQSTPQASSQSLFPPTYYACDQEAVAPSPAPRKVLPTSQVVHPSPQGTVLAAKKKCDWLEKCKLLRAIKDWKARCKIKMCPCCSGGHKSDKCEAEWGMAAPQGMAPVSSPQSFADAQLSPASPRPESRDFTERRDVVQRVSADGVGEPPQR